MKNSMESQIRQEIVDLCRRLNEKNLLASADGNVSYRLDDSRILVTPTGVNKNFLKPEDIAVIDLDGVVIEGKPSGERLMHLAVFRNVPLCRAVVHAHPPHAVALSLARPNWKKLPEEGMPEVILAAGEIPIVSYARPGTAAMGENLVPYLPNHRLLILSRHGALSWGEDLAEAYNGMERIEHASTMIKYAEDLGGISPLNADEVAQLKLLRKQLGPRTL